MELKPPAVLDACEADKATCHPPERALTRYVSNEIGPRRKKVVYQHLEACEECRKSVARLRAIARTFRDWERSAIGEVAQARRASRVANY
jgi:anti-sigma factor RsiW